MFVDRFIKYFAATSTGCYFICVLWSICEVTLLLCFRKMKWSLARLLISHLKMANLALEPVDPPHGFIFLAGVSLATALESGCSHQQVSLLPGYCYWVPEVESPSRQSHVSILGDQEDLEQWMSKPAQCAQCQLLLLLLKERLSSFDHNLHASRIVCLPVVPT